MDFKKIFKNIYFIIGACILLLAVICGSLANVNRIFYILLCLLCSAFCVLVAVFFISKIRAIKNNTDNELLPLTEQQKEYIKKSNRRYIFNYVIMIVIFLCASVIFIAYGVK